MIHIPKISNRWICERIVWLGVERPNEHKGKLLPLEEIERRFIWPYVKEGAKILSKEQYPEHYIRILYAEQIRGLKLELDESGKVYGPTCRLVSNLVDCREDFRTI